MKTTDKEYRRKVTKLNNIKNKINQIKHNQQNDIVQEENLINKEIKFLKNEVTNLKNELNSVKQELKNINESKFTTENLSNKVNDTTQKLKNKLDENLSDDIKNGMKDTTQKLKDKVNERLSKDAKNKILLGGVSILIIVVVVFTLFSIFNSSFGSIEYKSFHKQTQKEIMSKVTMSDILKVSLKVAKGHKDTGFDESIDICINEYSKFEIDLKEYLDKTLSIDGGRSKQIQGAFFMYELCNRAVVPAIKGRIIENDEKTINMLRDSDYSEYFSE